MKAIFILFILLTASLDLLAQDERYFRKIYSGELKAKPKKSTDYKVIVNSPNYRIDLNRDGIDELIKTQKRDGVDYLLILDHFGRKMLEHKLSSIGSDGVVFRIHLKTIAPKTDALIVHFYEGNIESTQFEASARLYFVTIDNRDLNQLHIYKGPHFFHEKEKLFGKYSVKRYSVNALDYNSDGINEISVSFNNISRIYFYVAKGIWKRI